MSGPQDLIRFLGELGEASGTPLSFALGVAAGELYARGWRVIPPDEVQATDERGAAETAARDGSDGYTRGAATAPAGEQPRADVSTDADPLAIALVGWVREHDGKALVAEMQEAFEGPVRQTLKALQDDGKLVRRGQFVTVPAEGS